MMHGLLALCAVMVPPLGLFTGIAPRPVMAAIALLWLAGLAIAMLLWAGPGALLMLLSSLAVAVLLLRRTSPSPGRSYR